MARHLTSEGNLVTEEYNHDWTAELVRFWPERSEGIHSAFLFYPQNHACGSCLGRSL